MLQSIHLVEGALRERSRRRHAFVEALQTPVRVFRHAPVFFDRAVLCHLMEVDVHPVIGVVVRTLVFIIYQSACFNSVFER